MSPVTAGRIGYVVMGIAVMAATLSAQTSAPVSPERWAALADAGEGARVTLTLRNGATVNGRVAHIDGDAVTLRELRTGGEGVTTRTGESESTGYTFRQADVSAAEVVSWPARAAEVARSLDQLRVMAPPGERISLVSASGERVSGIVTTITPSALSVRIGNDVRRFAEAEIQTVRQRRADSLRNGALIGFGAGAGVGLTTPCGRCHLNLTLAMGAAGAAIGVGIDALIKSEVVVFRGHGASARQISVVPQIAKSHKGLAVSLRF